MAKSKTEPRRPRTFSDPLAAALLPPPDETPTEREIRLKRENDARKVSQNIDEQIRLERNERKKSKAEVNVLLLGQSESGKSTTLKRECDLSLITTLSCFCLRWGILGSLGGHRWKLVHLVTALVSRAQTTMCMTMRSTHAMLFRSHACTSL